MQPTSAVGNRTERNRKEPGEVDTSDGNTPINQGKGLGLRQTRERSLGDLDEAEAANILGDL